MQNKKYKSLSTKIVISITIVSLTILLIVFAVFDRVNTKSFYTIEMEKANLIADTIEPLLALDIYLGLHDKTEQLTHKLIENKNILLVRVTQGGKILNETKSPAFESDEGSPFVVTKKILQPNSDKMIGQLELVYSNRNYKELQDKYMKITLLLLLGLSVVFFQFSLYIKKLLSPLKKIAASLKNYTPDKELNIPVSDEKNEIGLISGSLYEMQQKISDYAKNQRDINQYLEERVNEKTEELRKQLYTDSLTSLPNRNQLFVDFIHKITDIDQGVLLIVNIDDFKEINDFYGHIVGDKTLIELAKQLRNLFNEVRHIDFYRLSGDEFALLYEKNIAKEDLEKFINALIENIENMIFQHENNEISIRVTVGATFNMHSALEKADIALKYARKSRKPFMIYDEQLNIEEQYKANMGWVKKLKNAIEHDNIIPFYQPIFDNKSGQVASYECLMRMVDKNGEVLTPFHFLGIAKKSRLYTKLTKLMIEKSCSHFEQIDCMFSVNISAEDILDSDMVEFITGQVNKYNVAEKIIFEILESEEIENYKEVSQFIYAMKQLGCKIAIDDFGSGYSNFEHLLQLNIDYIKIDGTLIKNLNHDENARLVVETIVDFAQKLNIRTVAEFVHNEEVYEKVKALNIDRSQGFHLGMPQQDTVLS